VREALPILAAQADCGDSDLCRWLWRVTGQAWLAESSDVILVKPLRILMIVLIAMIVRYLLHRTINRLIRSTADGSIPAVLRPLKERMPTALQAATTIFPERRRQRAAAIGSVLRSFVTVVIYSTAALMILGELGVNLAPLLASVGIAGVALGFGAQSLVKDLLAGLFMLLEDQYGVGDTVDLGGTSGVVESIGLRVTTVRDSRGVVWYIRNGEIARVGNRSQGWARVVVDVPIGFAAVDPAIEVLRRAAAELAEDPEYARDLLEGPEVLGVEELTAEGAVVRATAKTSADAQFRIGRALRRRLTDALVASGIVAQTAARPGGDQAPGDDADAG